MPLERDEGEYAYAGQLLLQGIPPYKLAFNMKFPGAYFMYALLMEFFGQSPAGIHAGILCVTSLTAILIFFIGRALVSDTGALAAAAIYVCLAALPRAAGLAGHDAHFVSLFVCAGTGALLLARKRNSAGWWFLSGTAFGLGILMKQNAAFFPLLLIIWILWKALKRHGSIRAIIPFCGGCALPFSATAIGFACLGLWRAFFFWTFRYAGHYVSMLPLPAAPRQFATGFQPVFDSGIWVWIFGVAGLACVWRQREFFRFSRSDHREARPLFNRPPMDNPESGQGPAVAPRQGDGGRVSAAVETEGRPRRGNGDPDAPGSNERPLELAAVLFLAGMAATVPGFYFRNHYFLMAAPGLALLDAAFIRVIAKTFKNVAAAWTKWLSAGLLAFLLGDLLLNNARMWFDTPPVQLSRKLYPGNPFPESAAIARYIQDHSSPADTVAVLGSEPEIFFLSHRHSATGFIYVYSLTEPQPLAPRMGREFISQIETARPAFVVPVNMALSWYSLVLPQSLRYAATIQNWWAAYSTNYDLVGAIKISPDGSPRFSRDKMALNRLDPANADLLIYRRKSAVRTGPQP